MVIYRPRCFCISAQFQSYPCFLRCCLLLGKAPNTQLFPRPPELEPAVRFWTRVYTEVDTQSGLATRAICCGLRRTPRDRRQIENRRDQIQSCASWRAAGGRAGRWATESALWRRVSATKFDGQSCRQLSSSASRDRFGAATAAQVQYRQHIDAVIPEKGLPEELAVLPHVEVFPSIRMLRSNACCGNVAIDRAFSQRFMRIDHIVDERMDPYIVRMRL